MKCVNCAKAFNVESYAPRMLGCGHTFCHFCISTLLDCGELACPTCEHKQSVNGVKDVPLNRIVLDLVEEERDQKIPQECLCVFHKKVMKSFCNKCGECTCPDCYKDLHNKEFGCDEVCFSDDANLESSTVVKKLDNRIQTLTSYLKKGEEQLCDLKTSETSFKECYWSLSQHRMYLEANCESLRENLASLERSRASIVGCASNSDFIDCCKGLYSLKTHPQAARDIEPLPVLASSSTLCKNFRVVYLACLRKFASDNLNSLDSLATLDVDGSRSRLGHSISVDSNPLLLDLFKEFNSKHIRKIKLSWPLSAIEGEESTNLGGKFVHADIEVSEDQVETFYKIFSLGKQEDTFATNHYPNLIVLHKTQSNICVWNYNNNVRYQVGASATVAIHLAMLGLNTEQHKPGVNNLNIGGDQWPVLSLVSESAPELILAKFPMKKASTAFQLIGTWKIRGDVQDMPTTWQSTSWKLSSNI